MQAKQTAIKEEAKQKLAPVTWNEKVFRALDSVGRGYLYRDEILEHIKGSGTRFHK